VKDIATLNVNKYELVIFDWDGTLLNSSESYFMWDHLYVKRFYDTNVSLEYLHDLAAKLKTVQPDHSNDNPYFRYLDVTYGNGKTPIETIWSNVYSLSDEIRAGIDYKDGAPAVLIALRRYAHLKLALATNAERKDLEFYSSKDALTFSQINPLQFFDKVVTLNEVAHPKPHPETFQKVIDYFSVSADKVLIFEDSLSGVIAAKEAGCAVVAIHDDMSQKDREAIDSKTDFSVKSWYDILTTIGDESV
jgi:HAD superfamily hydrolase (TIGR01509 family)